jgi:hypothetical protein
MHKQKNPLPSPNDADAIQAAIKADEKHRPKPAKTKEIGGPKGLEPTRYGDWEKSGRCIDF